MIRGWARTTDRRGRPRRAPGATALIAALMLPLVAGALTGSPAAATPVTDDPGSAVLQPAASTPEVQRIAGADRFVVAASVSQRAFPDGAPVVFLANGLTFPDALSGAPAAALLGGSRSARDRPEPARTDRR